MKITYLQVNGVVRRVNVPLKKVADCIALFKKLNYKIEKVA